MVELKGREWLGNGLVEGGLVADLVEIFQKSLRPDALAIGDHWSMGGVSR